MTLFLFYISSCFSIHTFNVNITDQQHSIPKTIYGIFFEDINYAADGGLYGELLKNRGFEFPDHYMGWKVFGNVTLQNDGPFSNNPHYVRFGYSGHHEKYTGIENEGYFGIGYTKNAKYRFSFYARCPEGGSAKIRIFFCDPSTQNDKQIFTESSIKVSSTDWKKYTVKITSSSTINKGTLRLVLERDSSVVDLEHISLFPVDTYKGHENGLRKDLAERLEKLHPGILRFPGGCIVEGTDLKTRYQWKNSVGPVENRPLNENRWHYTFDYRFFPDYFQSYGLGFYEYFVLSEEIGSEPLPVLNVGLSCEFQNGDQRGPWHVDVDDLQPYIDDVLDLIEFANGDPNTNEWAKLRSDMGHPKPFNLKYVAIGNEQWGQIYPENLKPFVEQVRAKYPDIKIIGSSGPDPDGDKFNYLWPEMRKLGVDLVDEHFYRNEKWFLTSGTRYDYYSRDGPKVFAGEYACHGSGKKYNHFYASLLEAAFLTGIERNPDIVEMATYAPLFAHIDGWQWRPDLIWFDNLRSVSTCSYYVQQMFSTNKGTHTIPLLENGEPVSGLRKQDGLFASAVVDNDQKTVIIKIVNTNDNEQAIDIHLDGLDGTHSVKVIQFHSDDMDAENTLDDPDKIVPVEDTMQVTNSLLQVTIIPKAFYVFIIQK